MERYIKVSINTPDSKVSEILIAQLIDAGFEGFEEASKTVNAFIPESLFNNVVLSEIIIDLNNRLTVEMTFEIEYIENKNWNAEWEKNYNPVIVGDFCSVRASFHSPIQNIKHDLVITPKMSFGTGHHATTYMMISAMKNLNFENSSVLDFGTGTGVLGILAEKLGAKSILAIESDEGSVLNAMENISINCCSKMQIESRDTLKGLGRFDVILANINLSVILSNMENYRQHLERSGVLIGSGILETDEDKVAESAQRAGLKMERICETDNWLCFNLKIR